MCPPLLIERFRARLAERDGYSCRTQNGKRRPHGLVALVQNPRLNRDELGWGRLAPLVELAKAGVHYRKLGPVEWPVAVAEFPCRIAADSPLPSEGRGRATAWGFSMARQNSDDLPKVSAGQTGIVLDVGKSAPTPAAGTRGSITQLLEATRQKTTRIGIIGLGYVGLPLVHAFADAGFRVMGFDIDSKKIQKLLAGESYIKHIPPERIAALIRPGTFCPTNDFAKLRQTDVIIICVPTPLHATREPDLGAVTDTCQTIAAHLEPRQLVILESTTYPGTTQDVVRPILEQSGLKAGRDFYLAFSPEREDPGNPRYPARNIPKVVGGIDQQSLELAAALYAQVMVDVVRVSSTQVAEACKILENTYRAVNIALVNELKMLFHRMDIDIWEVIRAASTKPFGFQPFYPGPGLGGHCIPIDPFYLTWIARRYGFATRFIELAGEINTGMPEYVVNRVAEFLNEFGKPLKFSRVMVLGVAYKKDVDDPRESPAFVVMEKLLERSVELNYNDPHVPRLPKMRRHSLTMQCTELSPQVLAEQDCVLILTDHSAYDWNWIVEHSRLVVDTRNATSAVTAHRDRIRFA
jgi:UDP-N-acetyl-D-glucosamine dehydrogenase